MCCRRGVSSGTEHRLTAPCHKWDCKEACTEFTRAAQHCVEVTVGIDGPRGQSQTAVWGLSQGCASDDQESDAESLREMRVGVHPGAGVWQVVAAEDCPSSQMGSRSANSEQPCAVQRDCVGLLPFSSRRVGSARWPPCVPGSELARLHVCAAGRAAGCAGLAAGLCGDGGTLLPLLPWRPRDCPSAATTAARGTAQRTRDVYYLSHALPLQTNHQQRKPTRPPTTTITATDMPAMAPMLRLGPVGTHVPPSNRYPSPH